MRAAYRRKLPLTYGRGIPEASKFFRVLGLHDTIEHGTTLTGK